MRRAPVSPGVRLHADGVEFVVRSRHAQQLWLCLFDGEGARETARLPFTERFGDLHRIFVAGVGAGARYGLRADGCFDPRRGHWFDPNKLLVDPYATRLDRPFAHSAALTAHRGESVDTAALVPKAIIEAAPGAIAAPQRELRFIYEVSAKAYTQLDPRLDPALRGQLAGLAAPHAVERLRRLGVSHVELMPIAAWIDERHLPPLGLANAWGYNPVAFMAPDPRLAPGGLADLAQVVTALAQADIGVILDVVFNHTGESDEKGAVVSLRGLDNALYYRRATNGAFVNDAGCGNILDCVAPAVIELALDALRLYARLGVAGFRFDLATVLGRGAAGFSADAPLLTAIAADPILRERLLIAEPWDVGPGGYQLGAFRHPWREWNDRYRDDVRRFWRGDKGALGPFATRIAGSADLFEGAARRPSASVNFVAAHDGFSLRDLVAYSVKRNHSNGENNRDGSSDEVAWNCGFEGESDKADLQERRARDVRALLATLFLSRGTAMLTAGDEFGRTQGGNNNAYAQDNATTWLDWTQADAALTDYVAALARWRERMGVLTEDRFLDGLCGLDGTLDAEWLTSAGRAPEPYDWSTGDCIGLTLAPRVSEGSRVHLAFNRGAARPLVLPKSRAGRRWLLVVDSAAAFVTDSADDARSPPLNMPERSVLAFAEALAEDV